MAARARESGQRAAELLLCQLKDALSYVPLSLEVSCLQAFRSGMGMNHAERNEQMER